MKKELKTVKVDYETWKALRRLSVEEEKSIGKLIKEKIEEEKEMEKKNISVDHHQHLIEKNISWYDYPCINTKTGRRLPKTLGHYFDSWEDYLENGNDTNYNTKGRE